MTRPRPRPERLRVGSIGRPHGIGGTVRIVGLPDWFTLATGADLIVGGETMHVRLARGELVDLAGVGSREQADALRNRVVEIPAGEAPEPAEDAYWIFDLVGCAAVCGERRLGDVVDVLDRAANDILVIGDGLLVPFIREAVPVVDLEARVIEIAEAFAEPPGE